MITIVGNGVEGSTTVEASFPWPAVIPMREILWLVYHLGTESMSNSIPNYYAIDWFDDLLVSLVEVEISSIFFQTRMNSIILPRP